LSPSKKLREEKCDSLLPLNRGGKKPFCRVGKKKTIPIDIKGAVAPKEQPQKVKCSEEGNIQGGRAELRKKGHSKKKKRGLPASKSSMFTGGIGEREASSMSGRKFRE